MKFLFTMLLLLISTSLFAAQLGNGTSGGGASVVCRDNDKKITSAELLDTFEAPFLHGIQINYSNDDLEVQLERAADRLNVDVFYRYLFLNLIKKIKSKIEFLPEGYSLGAPSDIGESDATIIREGCRLEGVGFYNSDGILRVARTTYNSFSKTDKLAFLLHEALYLTYRTWHDQQMNFTSEKARKLTAMFFSNNVEDQAIFDYFRKTILAHNFDEVEGQVLLTDSFVPGKKIKVLVQGLSEGAERNFSLEVNNFERTENLRGELVGTDLVFTFFETEIPSLKIWEMFPVDRELNMLVFVNDKLVFTGPKPKYGWMTKRILFARSSN